LPAIDKNKQQNKCNPGRFNKKGQQQDQNSNRPNNRSNKDK
jgi:hypothetical protein